MKAFVCKVCGFISIDGSAPEKCPVCGAPQKAFENRDEAIKTPGTETEKQEANKKHIPVVKIEKKCGLVPEGCVDVQVRVGEILHPMLPEHHIMHIDVYVDRKFVSRIHLTPEKLNPAAVLHLKKVSGKVSVVELCNLHGAWLAEANI